MKRLAIIIFIPFFICCEQPNKIVIDEYQGYFEELSELIVGNESNKQGFKISAHDKEIIKTRNGLKIEFDASKLITEDGSLPSDSVDVVVTECINQNDFIKSNVLTISNDKLLVSGGAYNIEMYCKGMSLRLRENDSLTVHLPKFTDDEMALFYGQTDSLKQVEWKETKKSFSIADRPAEQEDSIDDSLREFEYYNPIKISSLGWINCDRFYGLSDLANLDYTFTTTEDTLVSKVLLIFKDINSVASHYYIKSRKSIEYEAFQNIPLGLNIRLVAVAVIDDQIFGYSKDIKTQENLNIQINLRKMTEEELNKILNEI